MYYCGFATSLALDSQGRPHIAYSCTDADMHWILKHAWNDGVIWHTETLDTESQWPSLAIDSSDHPCIGYHFWGSGTDYALKYARHNGTSWHIESVDTNVNSVGMWPSLALDAANRPHITYASGYLAGYRKDVRYAYYDGAIWHIETLCTDAQTSSLVLDGDGHPHVSYGWRTNSPLRYAFYNGTIWQEELVDSTSNIYCRLKLDTAGFAHISYSTFNYELRYATTAPGAATLRILSCSCPGSNQFKLVWNGASAHLPGWVDHQCHQLGVEH